jgi:hypothetical protein
VENYNLWEERLVEHFWPLFLGMKMQSVGDFFKFQVTFSNCFQVSGFSNFFNRWSVCRQLLLLLKVARDWLSKRHRLMDRWSVCRQLLVWQAVMVSMCGQVVGLCLDMIALDGVGF